MLISNAYAQTAAASSSMDSFVHFIPVLFFFAIFYFLMVRPQQKKAKEHKAMLDALSKGDEVVTQGGMAGRVVKVGDDFVSVAIADNVEVQMQKPAIMLVLPKGTLKNL